MSKHTYELAASILGFLGGAILSLDALFAVRRARSERGKESVREAVQKAHPGKMMAYNCSPSFNWEAKLDKATIYKHNTAIMGYIHDDGTRKGVLGASGIPDDGSVNPGAVDLNNIDDWYEFHQIELR